MLQVTVLSLTTESLEFPRVVFCDTEQFVKHFVYLKAISRDLLMQMKIVIISVSRAQNYANKGDTACDSWPQELLADPDCTLLKPDDPSRSKTTLKEVY